jgi:hypothetical protein
LLTDGTIVSELGRLLGRLLYDQLIKPIRGIGKIEKVGRIRDLISLAVLADRWRSDEITALALNVDFKVFHLTRRAFDLAVSMPFENKVLPATRRAVRMGARNVAMFGYDRCPVR